MMSFCVVPCSAAASTPCSSARDDVEREQPRRGRVDRHRRVHLVERDAVHQRRHVAAVGDRHADLADLTPRQLVVGVVARLRRQVERDRQPRLPLGQVAPVELVRLRRGRVTRVGADHPRPVALGQAVRHAETLWTQRDAVARRQSEARRPRAARARSGARRRRAVPARRVADRARGAASQRRSRPTSPARSSAASRPAAVDAHHALEGRDAPARQRRAHRHRRRASGPAERSASHIAGSGTPRAPVGDREQRPVEAARDAGDAAAP